MVSSHKGAYFYQMSKRLKIVVTFIPFVLLLLYAPPTTAQRNADSTATLSGRLLRAVDAGDIATVKSLLAAPSGQALAVLPVGLIAAGRAVEKSYFKIAHYILAVRNQPLNLKRERLAKAEKENTLPSKGGFINSKPEPPEAASPYPSRQVSAHKSSKPHKKEKLLLENVVKQRRQSTQPNPFDPSNTPSATLPVVK